MLTIRESVPIQQQGNALIENSYFIAHAVVHLHIDIFKFRCLEGNIQISNSLIDRRGRTPPFNTL